MDRSEEISIYRSSDSFEMAFIPVTIWLKSAMNDDTKGRQVLVLFPLNAGSSTAIKTSKLNE